MVIRKTSKRLSYSMFSLKKCKLSAIIPPYTSTLRFRLEKSANKSRMIIIRFLNKTNQRLSFIEASWNKSILQHISQIYWFLWFHCYNEFVRQRCLHNLSACLLSHLQSGLPQRASSVTWNLCLEFSSCCSCKNSKNCFYVEAPGLGIMCWNVSQAVLLKEYKNLSMPVSAETCFVVVWFYLQSAVSILSPVGASLTLPLDGGFDSWVYPQSNKANKKAL